MGLQSELQNVQSERKLVDLFEVGGWVRLQPSRQQQSTCTQWPARRKDGKKRAEEEKRKELRAEKKSRKRQAKAEEKQPMSGQVP